ncbi:9732_t:CDS:2 [Acaulospora morrowiae]|uniref:9732_t:CDS:1 n=1 Tax=Acaulospora morrowiae TaxID=94023 RepID=A0A9N9DMY9_9GLOM|nr:9732_t:CDS:2 [Acaulospora morrowiae]
MSGSTAETGLETPSSNQRTPEEVKEEKRLILEQVEYYFGDKNYPKDRFLKELSGKDPQGYVLRRTGVPIAIIHQFRKMQVYKDDGLIVEALRESPELLEVDESGTKVRRKAEILLPIPDHVKSTPMWSSIYAKGFPKDSKRNIRNEAFIFFQRYGRVIKVHERLDDQNKFKGSFFVQFHNHETAKKVSEMKLEFEESPIKMMMKFDYCEMKCKEKGMDPNTMRKQGQGQGQGQKKKKNGAAQKDLKFKKGCLLKFEGAGPAETWETIRKKVDDEYGKVIFVSYNSVEKKGIIHFKEAIAENVATKISNGTLEFDGIKPSVSVVEGQEETNYYQRKKDHNKPNKRNGSKGGNSRSNGKKNKKDSTKNVVTAAESERKTDENADSSNNAKSDLEEKVDLDSSIDATSSVSEAGSKRKLGKDTNLDDSPKATKIIKQNPDATVESSDQDTLASSVSAGSKRKLEDSTDPDDSSKETKAIKLESVEDSNS